MCSLHYLNELFGYQTITKWKVVMIYDALFSSYFISYKLLEICVTWCHRVQILNAVYFSLSLLQYMNTITGKRLAFKLSLISGSQCCIVTHRADYGTHSPVSVYWLVKRTHTQAGNWS